jgi:hypothetical protein
MDLNWEAIGALAETLGAIGVIASLIYVGRQFRHSSTTAIQAMNFDFGHMVGDSLKNVSVLRRGTADPSQLNEDELFQFSIFLYNFYSYLNFVHVQAEKGLVNPDLAQRSIALADFYHLTPGVRAWFAGEILDFKHGKAFSPGFLKSLDEKYGTDDHRDSVAK